MKSRDRFARSWPNIMSFPSRQLTASSDVRMRKVLTIPMARFARNVRFGPAAIALPVKPFTDPQCVSTERRTQQKREVRGINGNYDVVAIWSLTEQDDATNLLPGATQQIVRA